MEMRRNQFLRICEHSLMVRLQVQLQVPPAPLEPLFPPVPFLNRPGLVNAPNQGWVSIHNRHPITPSRALREDGLQKIKQISFVTPLTFPVDCKECPPDEGALLSAHSRPAPLLRAVHQPFRATFFGQRLLFRAFLDPETRSGNH